MNERPTNAIPKSNIKKKTKWWKKSRAWSRKIAKLEQKFLKKND
jgi:hypothetical protein